MSNSSASRSDIPIFGELWRRIQALPLPVPEDSLLLRVLVQTLVIVGIIATDVAAGTQISFWAVPLSVVGATWSWHRRRKRNVAVKFLLAMAMLVALFAFFGNLFTQLNDTRLVLAELLIQLQVLHSFDLPRRHDLGYSMVIGLILIGVAGTLSQTLAFAPLLLIFLALALPTLVLDYRSRLGLITRRTNGGISRKNRRKLLPSLPPELSLGRLSLILLLIVTLGLAIFASLPRVPGYQLRTFPVSASNQVAEGEREEINGISNPGYVTEGSDRSNGDSTGGSGSEGTELDDTFYYGFNTKINQNLRGQMQPKVVMRVRSQAEGFWRVLGFDRYTGQGWEISREQTATVERPSWSYRFFLPRTPTLAKTREVVQTYSIVSELPNIIPAMTQPKQLFFFTAKVEVDAEDSLRSPLSLLDGDTYTVISAVPLRDRSQLRQANTEYNTYIRDLYLQIPSEIADRVRQRTEEILAKSQKPVTVPYEQALYLAQYLKQHYTIQPNLPVLDEDRDLVEAFLFDYEGGYRDHFSTVLTIMLRSIGVPARLAVGFGPGEFNPFTGLYEVRNSDAYALTEVYFPQYGWFAFDPIPGHEPIPPSVEDYQTFGVLRQFWHWVAGWFPSPVRNLFATLFGGIFRWVARTLFWLWRLFTSGWVGLLTGLMLACGLAFLGWLAVNLLGRWLHSQKLAKLPPIESIYQQMLGLLKAQGYPKHPAQTPLEYATALRQHYHSEALEAIDRISQAYVLWRYGGQETSHNLLRLRLQHLIRDTQGLGKIKRRHSNR